jgi:two-component system chemotaxis response regulator CheY
MKKVLIVDDAAFMRSSIKNMLVNTDFEVVGEASNGAIAVQMFAEYKPDIVTMDITMPEMSGIDSLKLIKKIDPQAKVVMVSAMGQETLVREALKNGARSFVVKPFQDEFLLLTLNKVVS